MTDVLTRILPIVAAPASKTFNAFDVMHHGTDEKQLSNLFAWLLDTDGSHELGSNFVRWFLDEVNASLALLDEAPVAIEPFEVSQERNTRESRVGADIADIVLVGETTALVIENFYVSDGHGHSFDGYMDYGRRLLGGRSVVVMLCEVEDPARLRDGWERAPVVLYSKLVRRLADYIATNPSYQVAHPDQHWFINQMKGHFLKGMLVNEAASLEFIKAMCDTGEANRFGTRNAESAFAEFIRKEAERRFVEAQALLNTIKKKLRQYLSANLGHLNAVISDDAFDAADIGLAGAYQWDVCLSRNGERVLFVMFGPSAWTDNERNFYGTWKVTVDDPDYSQLFIGYQGAVRQSSVSMQDVLDRLDVAGPQLLDEVAAIVAGS